MHTALRNRFGQTLSHRIFRSVNFTPTCVALRQHTSTVSAMQQQPLPNTATERFRSYLRINTVTGRGDYYAAVSYLKRMAEDVARLQTRVVEMVPGKPILIASWPGSDPSLPSILLNSHYDVVPADADKWSHPPFEAYMDDKTGDIFARGAQDMKCVTMQYLEAIAMLRSKNITFPRSIHLTVVPDEETGGVDGMGRLVRSEVFRGLGVGCAMDEGLASEDEGFSAFYSERAIWNLVFTAVGPPGHASQLPRNTATEKLHRVASHLLAIRHAQLDKLSEGASLGSLISVNNTVQDAGDKSMLALNVIPQIARAGWDIRLPPSVDMDQFEREHLKALVEKEEGLSYEFKVRTYPHSTTSTDRQQNAWWGVFSDACAELGLTVREQVFPAATDSRYLRQLGIPVVGFSPINNTPILLHANDERLSEKVFLRGIQIYETLIQRMGAFKQEKNTQKNTQKTEAVKKGAYSKL